MHLSVLYYKKNTETSIFMINKEPISNSRIRYIRQCTFGWIDHNFLHYDYVQYLSKESLLLYFFLCLVADRNGCSYYDYERICNYLKVNLEQFMDARHQLIEESLIITKDSVYQVLSLSKRKAEKCQTTNIHPQQDRQIGFQDLKQILKNVKEH